MLSFGARAGLVSLTMLLCVFVFSLSLAKSRYIDQTFNRKGYYLLAPIIDLLITWALCIAALRISPQILYIYYMLIFDDLPLQWVAHQISMEKLLQYIKTGPIDSLNTMISGLSFWALSAGVLLFWTNRYINAFSHVVQAMLRGLVVAVVSIVIFSLR